MFFGCNSCARKKVLEHLCKVWYIINIETKERKTAMKTTILNKIAKKEKTAKNAYAKGNKMFGQKMQTLRTEWIALCEEAVSQGIIKKTSTSENEYNGYNFGDVCA